MKRIVSRRDFLTFIGLGATASFLAACGAGARQRIVVATATTAPEESAAEAPTVGEKASSTEEAVQVVVGDVLDYILESSEWPGQFGSVTLKLHEALFKGDKVYHIRTDASDPTFAQENGLVHVPLLNAALNREDATSPLYTFANGVSEQRPVLASVPGMDTFSPALRVHQVTFNGEATLLDSVESIETAETAGEISVEKLNLIVNFPLIKWAEGGLTVDSELEVTLGPGQLFAEPDLQAMTVTMKLHQCYPGSRYIVTDTSTPEMAPMMNISASPPTQSLVEVGATDEIWVFGNGIEGSGAMGFQPAIFDNKATQAAWSPFWNHFTVVWTDETKARILKSSAEIKEAIEAGELEQFNGVPDSHPNGFVVNCPAPILAPNNFGA